MTRKISKSGTTKYVNTAINHSINSQKSVSSPALPFAQTFLSTGSIPGNTNPGYLQIASSTASVLSMIGTQLVNQQAVNITRIALKCVKPTLYAAVNCTIAVLSSQPPSTLISNELQLFNCDNTASNQTMSIAKQALCATSPAMPSGSLSFSEFAIAALPYVAGGSILTMACSIFAYRRNHGVASVALAENNSGLLANDRHSIQFSALER
jgi:hypothetical protein